MAKMKKEVRLPYEPPAHVIFDGDTANTQRYDDVYSVHRPGRLTEVRPEAGGQQFTLRGDGAVALRLEFWSDDVVRLRYAKDDFEPDFSYARDPAAVPVATEVTHAVEGDRHVFTTASLRLEFDEADGSLRILDGTDGAVLHEYATPFYCRTTLMRGLDQVRLQLRTDEREGFYGLGDKAWDTDLNGRYLANWTSDAFAYGRDRDVLYRAIPFYYGLREGRAYGIFLDNTYRTHFDFNSHRDGLTTIWADGGAFDYFFINGPELDAVATRYADLTGRPELPPLWALGYHQCRWSYYPESRVRELAANFREKRFPCDAIYLDIDYMDGYRCFTWNKEHFPDPKGMIADLLEDDFHTVVMIDPGIRVDEDYAVYRSGREQDAFCRRSTGEMMVGPVWPPACVWPDYTDPDVRAWWGQLYRELYNEQGVSGFWNDMNEPAMFQVNALTIPDDVRHDHDGHPCDHKKAHNIYGMQMTRATYEGLKQLQPAKRPFLLGRANFSGGQRHASLWTGDNVASWEHLELANRQCLRLAISGYSFVGTDIGGFVDDPSPELLTRWLQLAVFHPLMRVHSMGNNTDGAAEAEADEVKKAEEENRQDQEPWVHGGEHADRNRLAIELRYQLLPYLYGVFQHHVATGQPVLRNLFFYDQTDPQCRKYGDQFLCGDDLLVCPVTKPGIKSLQVYLPRGDWYDFWTGRRYTGRRKLRVNLKADRLPIFARAGAILPAVDPAQSTAELAVADTLHLTVFLNASGSGRLYWDAGEGYGYEVGQYCERYYRSSSSGDGVVLRQEKIGAFNPNFKYVNVRLVGLTEAPGRVTVDGEELPHALRFTRRVAEVRVPFDFEEVEISALGR